MLKIIFKGIILLLVGIIIDQSSTFAQTHEIGLQVGAMNYKGELAPIVNLKDTQQGWGLFYRANLTKAMSLRINGLFGTIEGSDKNSNDLFARQRNHQFRTNLWEISLLGEYNFLNFRNEGRKKVERKQNFTPYLSFGIGYMQFVPMLNGAPSYSTYSLIIPLGVGMKWAIGRNFNAGVELVARNTYTTYLDDLGLMTNKGQTQPNNPKYFTGNPNSYDKYFFTSFTISYLIRDKGKDCPVVVE
ncbi:MAG: hypothetical protein EAZ44_05010 [Cytophagia bacterium]|nr:MAG: hypothetical protein EAY69_10290 [Cytophagales bacterium]TAG04273.1 MAG: hypothetical protein EAZ44_05010 [Cytophagia bacterium]TAG46307.1 MAG: hypothetical protein EAZ31_00585 [Cytophagia bacterium]TAH29288.1 MAG: hypothetical protein EAZ06_07160 [Cytophagales bacterium]